MSKKTDKNLAGDVMRDAGKSQEEIDRTIEITGLDAAAAEMYGDLGNSIASPVHRSTWAKAMIGEFAHVEPAADPVFDKIIADSLAALRANKEAGLQWDANGKVSEKSIADLGKAGWWGLRVPKEFGGSDVSTVNVMRGISILSAAGFPNEAGLQSVHACIGAVDPLRTFGSPEQKAKYLPGLATGERMSAFALTEPGAGSDLSALRTMARKTEGGYLVTGEKVFITNSWWNRTVCLVSKVEGEEKPAVFVIELPGSANETFELVKYGLHPLKHCFNHGLKFNNFFVPAENRLTKEGTNGMIVAYHGLNYGRIAVLANAAGALRQIQRSITPKAWGEFRRTMGKSIQDRSLVRERIARVAGLILACDALRDWCSTKLDQGYRGELECTVAKVFGSWAQQEGAIEHGMLTHGGRAMREGNLIGDNLFDFLAALIYEGENHMLLMKYFLELGGNHGERFMLPIGEGLKSLKKGKISGAWQLLRHGVPFAGWCVKALFKSLGGSQSVPGMDKRLQSHVNFALREARKLAVELTYYMVKHQVKLADRQPRMVALSKKSLFATVMMVTAMHAHKKGDKVSIDAADILCQTMKHKITGELPSDAFFYDCDKMAEQVIAGDMAQLEGTIEAPIVHPYKVD